ncbi:MAG TPA: Ig-like domain-containing protein [Gemmatimonadaceae bacterium]|nr:Ig-like domain-containing protein [Gemmatimonadaceae bacterium]
MADTTVKARGFSSMFKLMAASASTGAALVSILSFMSSYGIIGGEPAHKTVGTFGAKRVAIAPAGDTASAIGDTLLFATTVTDSRGATLVGVPLVWSSGDPNVAAVEPDGSVIARGPGTTNIVVTVGELSARARVYVRQTVASVRIAGDSAAVVPEGERQQLPVAALDARGYVVAGRAVQWSPGDSGVVRVDTAGYVTGVNPGRTFVRATVDGVTGHGPVRVVALPASMVLASGGSQRAPAGANLPQPVAVRVLSRRGRPVEGALVRFRPAENLGTLAPAAVYTDAEGRARATWTLSDRPGRQTALAAVDRVDSALAIVAEADPVPGNTRAAALEERLSGPIGDTLAAAAGVRLTDSTGRPLADVPVTWTAQDGGSVAAAAARTDSLGELRVRWTLGPRAGTQRLRALIGSGRNVPPFVLSATATAGVAHGLAVAAGDDQRAAAGTRLKNKVVIRVTDAAGNPAAGAAVVLAPSAGSLPDSVVNTDAAGIAAVTWTLGRTAGPQTLQAKVEGVAKGVEVSATAVAGAPANIEFVDAPADAATGKTLKGLQVAVTDVHGNPVPDAPVTFTAKAGTTSPARVVTDGKGRARTNWTLAPKAGEQQLAAAVRGTDVRTSLAIAAGTAAAGGTPKTAKRPEASPTPTSAPPKVQKPAPKRGTGGRPRGTN